MVASEHDIETAALLRMAIGRLSRRLRPTRSARDAGLTPTSSTVLLRVIREGRVRLSDLAAAEGINPTLLSRVIAGLVEGGLVERTCDPGDRRAAWVDATQQGRRLAERMRRERTDALSAALAELPAAERRLVASAVPALEALAERLRQVRE